MVKVAAESRIGQASSLKENEVSKEIGPINSYHCISGCGDGRIAMIAMQASGSVEIVLTWGCVPRRLMFGSLSVGGV